MRHIIILLVLIASISCAPNLDRERLLKLPIFESPEHSIRFSMDDRVTQDPEFWGAYLDDQVIKWRDCSRENYNTNPILNSSIFLGWRVILVEGEFRCMFDSGICTGEIVIFDDPAVFITAYEDFEMREYKLCDEMTPSLCHEWSHICSGSSERRVCLRADHRNIEDLKLCL